MNEYVINSGNFNMIIRPGAREYYILEKDDASAQTLKEFVDGADVDYSRLTPCWFKYKDGESWTDFDKKNYTLGKEFSETELIDRFVLKKFNFGSLVALRDTQTQKVKIFKRDKL